MCITQLIYFRTKFYFPIYDRLVFDGLVEEGLLKRPQKPSKLYFELLTGIKNKYNISFDDLDKYFWVCGKIREGNLSLLIPNIETYKNEFLEKLKLTNDELQSKSNKFNKVLANKLVSGNMAFNNSKLEKIQLLAKSIKNETVFDKMKAQLDKYEKDILESFNNNEWHEVENMDIEIEKHKKYADETFKKNKRVNIRLSQKDINLLKIKAMEEGLPYQTLMASVLHKFATNKSN